MRASDEAARSLIYEHLSAERRRFSELARLVTSDTMRLQDWQRTALRHGWQPKLGTSISATISWVEGLIREEIDAHNLSLDAEWKLYISRKVSPLHLLAGCCDVPQTTQA